LLDRSPLRPWLSRRIGARLDEGRLGNVLGRHFGLRRVQMLAGLTLWAERYEGVLSDLDPTLLLGDPPGTAR